ncbi:RtcB family protein [Pontibacter liquoris]|uniref:RtcB family protein n=1 Tax=Pontibacter liquoris TaxID=2905677 RepID=UPI003462B4F4
MIVYHKVATLAVGKGVLGIIPGSMATPGFVVRGKGEASSLNSASHGAGRVMFRTKADALAAIGTVVPAGGVCGSDRSGLDEAPMVYRTSAR